MHNLYIKIDELFKENNESKFIIFIANRIVAHFLKPALTNYLRDKYKNKNCNEIIGINKKKSDSGITLTPSLTLKQMNDIISKFNKNKFDILIGTSAIEEGLDIQSCNAVLALVELNTPKSFIQIKGRARKSKSHFYIFTNSAYETKIKIKDFINIGEKMKELFGTQIIKDFRKQEYIFEKPSFICQWDDKSHSKITMGNTTMLFNEIKQQIESMNIKFITKINVVNIKNINSAQEYKYIGIISIDTNLKDLEKEFPFKTQPQNTKDNAIRECHYHALSILKAYKYLDSHLKFNNPNSKYDKIMKDFFRLFNS